MYYYISLERLIFGFWLLLIKIYFTTQIVEECGYIWYIKTRIWCCNALSLYIYIVWVLLAEFFETNQNNLARFEHDYSVFFPPYYMRNYNRKLGWKYTPTTLANKRLFQSLVEQISHLKDEMILS